MGGVGECVRWVGEWQGGWLAEVVSSGGWVKIKLELPHFHVSDTCVSTQPDAPVAVVVGGWWMAVYHVTTVLYS